MQSNKYAVVANDVVIIETDDKPGGLSVMLKMLEGDDIRIEYSYTAASVSPGIAEMVFRFSDNTRAIGVLERNGLKSFHRPGQKCRLILYFRPQL